MSRRPLSEDDDGRTIADMSGVERPSLFHFRPSRRQEETPSEGEIPRREPIEKHTRRAYILAAVGSALLVTAIFLAVAALFIWLVILVGRQAM